MRRLFALALCLLVALPAMAGYDTGGGGSVEKPNIVLPNTIHVAGGTELNIWSDQLDYNPAMASGPYHGGRPYALTYSATVGYDTGRGYRFARTDATSTTLTIQARTWTGKPLSSTMVNISAVSATGGSGTSQVLVIGDSLLYDDIVVHELDDLFVADGGGAVTFLGTEGNGDYQHEAFSGWTLERFTTDYGPGSNPFWVGGVIDFQSYMTNTAQAGDIDYYIIQLGINDIYTGIGAHFASAAEIEALMVEYDTLITAALSATKGYPDAHVIVSIPPIGAATTSAIGANYGASDTWVYYEQNMKAYQRALIARYDLGAYSAQVSVCATNVWVDRWYAYGYDNQAASYRSSNQLFFRHNNYVHPYGTAAANQYSFGKGQQSDAFYGELRYQMEADVPMGTNLFGESENFATWWTAIGSPTQGADILAPDGVVDAEVWTTAGNTVTSFDIAAGSSGITAANDNVISYHVKYPGSTQQFRLLMTVGAASSRSIDLNVTNATTAAMAYSAPYPLPAGDDWGYEVEPNGWLRLWWYHDGSATGETGTVAAKLYLDRAKGQPSAAVPIWGAMFEQGVVIPSAYSKVP